MSPFFFLLNAALAGDVLLPSFTPQTTSDFALADRFTEATLDAMRGADVDAVPPDKVLDRVGDVADGCAEEPRCTPALFDQFPDARIAVVGSVTWAGNDVAARVRFYSADDSSPIEVLSVTIPEDQLPGFADQVAFFAKEMVGLVPPRSHNEVAERPPPGPPDDPDEDLDEPPPTRPPPRDEPPKRDTSAQDRERNVHGLPPRTWQRYVNSGLSYADWKDDALVRAGCILLEVNAGAAFGDVDRRYDTRVAVSQLADGTMEQADVYQYESFITGNGFTVGGAVGYLPQWWLEIGLSGGVLFGHKQLTSGWERYKDGSFPQSDARIYDTATATMGTLEPRLRVYFVAAGPVKPYVLAAGNIRFYDGYAVPDLEEVDYLDRTGGVALGFTGGAGVAFDIPGGAIGFLEVPWTSVVTPEPYLFGGQGFVYLPEPAQGTRQILMFRGGLGVRL